MDCSVANLIAQSRCFKCLPNDELNDVKTYLLCQIANKPGTVVFNPAEVAGLEMWYSGDVGVTQDGTGGVSLVADRAGNLHNLVGLGGANNPRFIANAKNGLPGFQFISANSQQFLISPNNLVSGTSFFAICAYKGANAAGNTSLWAQSALNRQILCTAGGTNKLSCQDGINQPQSVVVDDYSQFVAASVFFPAPLGTVVYTLNGTNVPLSAGATTVNSITSTTVGNVVGFFSDMTVLEALFYKAAVSATDQASLFNYLRTKYALY